MNDPVDVLTARLAEVEKENEALRAALRAKMAEYKEHDPGFCVACDKARALLADEEE